MRLKLYTLLFTFCTMFFLQTHSQHSGFSYNDIEKNTEVTIKPNQQKGIYNVSLTLEDFSDVHVYVFDLLGQLKKDYVYQHRLGKVEEKIDLTDLENGIYLIQVTFSNQKLTKKIVYR